MKKLKRILLTLVASLSLLMPAVPVLAQDSQGLFGDACRGVTDATLCNEKDTTQEHQSNTIYGPNGIITKAVKLLSFVVGIAAVIMMIVGGFKYVTATGDSNNINSAKNTILYAIVGLVVATLSQVIIIFVLNKL